jgi:hypothetical protein
MKVKNKMFEQVDYFIEKKYLLQKEKVFSTK